MRGGAAGGLMLSDCTAGMRAQRLGRIAISALMVMAGSARIAIAQNGNSIAKAPIIFEIDAQPLAPALDTYARVAGLEVLYDSELAAGRRSTAVRGVLIPDVALRALLEGTGLTVLYTGNAFSIVPTPTNQRNASLSGSIKRDYMPYLALVQGTIEHAFCQQTDTMPGQYRAALRFRLGASGEVLYPQLLASTGDRGRDRKIAELLRHVSVEQSPPPDMPQPVTMIVSPRSPAQSGDCRVGQRSSVQRTAP